MSESRWNKIMGEHEEGACASFWTHYSAALLRRTSQEPDTLRHRLVVHSSPCRLPSELNASVDLAWHCLRPELDDGGQSGTSGKARDYDGGGPENRPLGMGPIMVVCVRRAVTSPLPLAHIRQSWPGTPEMRGMDFASSGSQQIPHDWLPPLHLHPNSTNTHAHQFTFRQIDALSSACITSLRGDTSDRMVFLEAQLLSTRPQVDSKCHRHKSTTGIYPPHLLCIVRGSGTFHTSGPNPMRLRFVAAHQPYIF